MGKYEVRRLKEDEYGKWNEFVEESSQGTLFHTTYWLGASGKDFEVFQCFKGQELVGGVPVVYSRLVGIGIVYNPPLTPYGGPIFRASKGKYVGRLSTRKKISGALLNKLKDEFGCIIDWQLSPTIVDLQPYVWAGFSTNVRYTYLLSIGDLDKVWESMDASRGRDIRRAEKDGVTVDISDDFGEVFDLVRKTYGRQEGKIEFREPAFRYNEVLREKDQCKSFIAKNSEGGPIASVYIVWDRKRAYYLLGGYDPARAHHGGTALAMWEAIKFTKEDLSLNEFDFEGSMIPEIERFFRKFGGRLTPCYSVSWAKASILLWLSRRNWLRKILGRSVYYG